MKRSQKGFTLIELLVVISIIAVLASVILVAVKGAEGAARDAKRKSDLHQIQIALESYYNTYGGYPSSAWPAIDYKIINSLAQQPNMLNFISSFPHDPSQGPSGGATYNTEYLYISDSYNNGNGNTPTSCSGSTCNTSAGHYATKYTLYATLENQSSNNLSASDANDEWLLTNFGPPIINYKLCSLAGCI